MSYRETLSGSREYFEDITYRLRALERFSRDVSSGRAAYDLAVSNGYTGTYEEWLGLVGVSGGSILYGSVPPDSSVGANGDFYIDTVTWMLYGPKASDVWPAGISLIGPSGSGGGGFLSGVVPPGPGDGVDGDFYIDTATTTMYGPKAGGVWPAGVPLIGAPGAPGAPGADGKTVLNGVVPPGPGDGVDGDFWIDTATDFLYGPKAAGVWPAGVSLVGPAGPTGPAGASGSMLGAWRVSTTVGPVPASGRIRYDNATQASATNLYVSHETFHSVDIELLLGLIEAGDTIFIQEEADSLNFQIWEVTGAPSGSHALTYWTFPVTLTSSGGTGTTNFANNLDILMGTVRASATGGAAGGDLTGTYPNPAIAADAVTVAKIAGNTIAIHSATAPLLPKEGQLWFDTDNGRLLTYYLAGTVWVEVGAASDFGSTSPVAFTAVNLTLDENHSIVQTTVSAVTINLPTSVGILGRRYTIDNASTGIITVDADGAELIQGLATQSIPSDSSMTVYSDDVGWRII